MSSCMCHAGQAVQSPSHIRHRFRSLSCGGDVKAIKLKLVRLLELSMTTLSAASGRFKVHGSELSRVCVTVRGACWHRIHLLQAWIGCWKRRLDKAKMVCRLSRTDIIMDFACRRCLYWINCLNSSVLDTKHQTSYL